MLLREVGQRLSRRFLVLMALFLTIAGIYWKLSVFGERYVWFDYYDMCALVLCPRST